MDLDWKLQCEDYYSDEWLQMMCDPHWYDEPKEPEEPEEPGEDELPF